MSATNDGSGLGQRGQLTTLRSCPGAWEQFEGVRQLSLAICSTLESDDYMLQAMDDVSPAKWHLAHTTWFFERFILTRCQWYEVFHPSYDFLFNSYYRTAGAFHSRPRRGLLSRPSTSEITGYRAHVEAGMKRLLLEDQESFQMKDHALVDLLELGLNHEQQHQELLLSDIKYNFFSQPLAPALRSPHLLHRSASNLPQPMNWIDIEPGIHLIGASGEAFSYDNERPEHTVFVDSVSMGSRLVSNQEYQAFIEDGGYEKVALWLSEGWDWIVDGNVQHPLYWQKKDATWQEFTLHGWAELDPSIPVSHINYFEADAFARWSGARLPTEQEWEIFAGSHRDMDRGQGFDLNTLHAKPAGNDDLQLSSLWQWTSSCYGPYPGFKPLAGNLAEYNGKFMVNQYVLRGGSYATPPNHLRDSYRNFYPTNASWQFSGIRLAKTKEN